MLQNDTGRLVKSLNESVVQHSIERQTFNLPRLKSRAGKINQAFNKKQNNRRTILKHRGGQEKA